MKLSSPGEKSRLCQVELFLFVPVEHVTDSKSTIDALQVKFWLLKDGMGLGVVAPCYHYCESIVDTDCGCVDRKKTYYSHLIYT